MRALVAACGGGVAAAAAHEVRAAPQLGLLLDASSWGLAEGSLVRAEARYSPLVAAAARLPRCAACALSSAAGRAGGASGVCRWA